MHRVLKKSNALAPPTGVRSTDRRKLGPESMTREKPQTLDEKKLRRIKKR